LAKRAGRDRKKRRTNAPDKSSNAEMRGEKKGVRTNGKPPLKRKPGLKKEGPKEVVT